MARRRRDLNERVVVVTGAASGIGRATAEAFLRAGARVHGADVDGDRLAAAAAALPAAERSRYATHRVDCGDPEAVQGLADAVFAAHGRVDVLHNNAGVVVCGPAETLTLRVWRHAVDVNLMGVVHGVLAFVPRMLAQPGGGHVVNTASISGLVGFPICAPYSATKFAVVGLSAVLDAELGPRGVRVSALCPGMVHTRVLETGHLDLPGPGRRWLAEAMARFGLSPEQVADAVLREVRAGRGGVRPLGLGTAPLWWLQRLSPGGMSLLWQAVSAVTLGRRGAGCAQADAGPATEGRSATSDWGVLVVHPSRRSEAAATREGLAQRLARQAPTYRLWVLRDSMDPIREHARGAPSGATFRVVPLLLAPGAHFDEDVQALARAVREAAPELRVVVAPPLLDRSDFLDWLLSDLERGNRQAP